MRISGDRATFDVSLSTFNETIITGRNFDDRLGVFCMVEAMQALKDTPVSVDIRFNLLSVSYI